MVTDMGTPGAFLRTLCLRPPAALLPGCLAPHPPIKIGIYMQDANQLAPSIAAGLVCGVRWSWVELQH